MPQVSPDIQEALDRGALVLAPTPLAASELRAAFDRQQQQLAGERVWEPANVLSWTQWLGSLWTALTLQGHESRLLLNPAQEESLWRDLITPTLEPANQSSAPAFAALARSAFALAAAYGLSNARMTAAAQTEDTEEFARWATGFTRTCGRNGYLPAAQLPAALVDHLERLTLTTPAELQLTGFLEFSPADASLLNSLRRCGTRIIEHTPPPALPVTRFVLRASTEAEELLAAAHWIRNHLDEHIAEHGPEYLPTIHVVLTGPHPDLAALNNIFREVLAPELDDITADPSSAPWEHSAGWPLTEQPIITTLLRLLRGLVRPLPLDDVTALLLSPYLGPQHDRNEAARFDAWALRDRPPLRPEFTFVELHRRAQSSPFGQTTLGWLGPLLAFLRTSGDLSGVRSHAAWSAFIRDLAATVHWPGGQPLTAAEFAATQAWDHTLDGFATLDFTGRRVPFAEALAALEHQVQTATFRLPVHPPVRILSATEAAAVPCDALLLLQASDTNWPPAAHPHPLISWQLQAQAGMPGADSAKDAARAERLTAALLNSPHVFVSHAAEVNEAPQRLAPALAHLIQTQSAPVWRELRPSSLIPPAASPMPIEEIVDDTPLAPLPSPQVPGGATVLQLQAACGFRAFAEIRLRSTEPRAPELGMDAGRAGSLLHKALEIFWNKAGSQASLIAYSDEECDGHLMAAIEQAFATPPFVSPDDPWDKAYRALQMQRLFELLKGWLRYERSRAPFTVLTHEQERPITVGPLELHLRVDRIDQIESAEDGSPGTVLIDYKTGADVRVSAWESERPDQPQLPLYALLPSDTALRGLAFGRVRRGAFAWTGIQAEADLLGRARIEPDLQALIETWRSVLTDLAEQFAAGDHSVNPKSYPLTCTHCGQRFLCRLDPNTLLAATLEEDNESHAEEEFTHA